MTPRKEQKVNVNISELIPTPFISATLVNEVLKGLLFQKCQLPYPYSWLKTVVEKRRKNLNTEENISKKLNITFENHFRIVSNAYDTLNSIMKGLTQEFCESDNTVLEIIIIFGSTPTCPKEIFTLVMPTLLKGHNERNHIVSLNKHLQKVLRNIFLSQTWMDSIDGSTTCTNTYIYLKRSVVRNDTISDLFEICNPVQFSTNIKHSVFTFSYEASNRTNCCDMLVFDEWESDVKDTVTRTSVPEETNQEISWCRSKSFFKGFKDCFVDKISVCELW